MSKLVLDVSRWDEGIDLAAWKRKHNLWGVIVKCGGNEGGRYMDRCFAAHYANAKAAGLHIGAYYYSTATDTATAKADAQHCVSLLKGREFDLPIYIDVEDAGQTTIGKRRLTDVILTFIRTVEAAGFIGGVYTSGSWWANNVYADELRPYANWIAWWTASKPQAISDVGMWQFGSMRLSDGDIQHDDVSGYVDANLCYVDYPARKQTDGGTTVAKLGYADAAAEVMDHFIDHDAHGYSQINRDGTAGVETITLSDGTQVSFQSGDRDCSRLVQTCNVVIGALPRGMHMWTGNEREILLENGFVEVSLDEVQRGDVLWREGHTELYLGNGIEGGARRSEYHSIDGATGDQDGEEIARSAYVKGHWTNAYRCTKVRPDSKPAPTPAKQKVKAVTRGVYRVYDAGNSRHHWTSDAAEAQKLVDAGWTYEGVAWKSSVTGSKVYRAYNPKTGDHLLCTSAARMLDALGKGWRYEGVAFLAGGKKPVYELYDSGHKEHFYTASPDERNACKGWMSDKGIGFYV